MEKCPCNSQKDYTDCCSLYLEGNAKAPTAEALMRSRYTAHVKHKIDYIIQTVHPSTREKSDRKAVESWAKEAVWTRLEVLQTRAGKENDETGQVVFKAHYKHGNQLKTHYEDSTFKKENGEWFYVDGKEPERQIASVGAKIGRNDVCYCGSGKKFKKCCGGK